MRHANIENIRESADRFLRWETSRLLQWGKDHGIDPVPSPLELWEGYSDLIILDDHLGQIALDELRLLLSSDPLWVEGCGTFAMYDRAIEHAKTAITKTVFLALDQRPESEVRSMAVLAIELIQCGIAEAMPHWTFDLIDYKRTYYGGTPQ